jgi:hypothetical protein
LTELRAKGKFAGSAEDSAMDGFQTLCSPPIVLAPVFFGSSSHAGQSRTHHTTAHLDSENADHLPRHPARRSVFEPPGPFGPGPHHFIEGQTPFGLLLLNSPNPNLRAYSDLCSSMLDSPSLFGGCVFQLAPVCPPSHSPASFASRSLLPPPRPRTTTTSSSCSCPLPGFLFTSWFLGLC